MAVKFPCEHKNIVRGEKDKILFVTRIEKDNQKSSCQAVTEEGVYGPRVLQTLVAVQYAVIG